MIFTRSSLLLAAARGGLFQVQTVAGECSRVVHCLDGMAYDNRNGADFSSPTGKTCQSECNGECCRGYDPVYGDPCSHGAFSVCADGSCNGSLACHSLGMDGSVGLVSGPSCTGGRACLNAGVRAQGGTFVDITSSCRGYLACGSAGSEGGTIGDITNSCNGYLACMNVGYQGAVGDVTDACNGDQACNYVGKGNTQFASNTVLDSCCNSYRACEYGGCFSSGVECVPFQDGTCPAATSSPTTSSSPTGKPTVSPSPTGTPTGSPTPKPTVSSLPVLVQVGPSDNESTEMTVDNLTNYECPPTVDNTNWDRDACGDLCDVGDTFEVSVSGNKLTVRRPNENGWAINLAFPCTFIGTTAPSMALTGSPSAPPSDAPSKSTSVSPSVIPSSRPSKLLSGSPSAPPSDTPSESMSVSPSVVPGDWPCPRVVHCHDGNAYHNRNGADFTSPTGKTCKEECDGECCDWYGSDACTSGSFSVCADGSCTGTNACYYLGNGGSVGLVSGPSCVGYSVCEYAGTRGTIGNITNSCTEMQACSSLALEGVIGDVTNSCNGMHSCIRMGKSSGVIGDVSDSCKGISTCWDMGRNGFIGDVSNACIGDQTCVNVARDNKQFGSNTVLYNCCSSIPGQCKDGAYHIQFQDGTCPAVTFSPAGEPTVSPTPKPTSRPSSSPTDDPTSSPTTNPAESPKLVVCGKGTGCREGNVRPATESEVHPVRCCSDVKYGGGWRKQEHCNVAASSLTQHCHEASFAEALQFCHNAGGRLCTQTELANRCTIQTGCGFDARLVWSSSPEVSSSPLVEPSAAPTGPAPTGLPCATQQDLQELREEVNELRALLLSIHDILDPPTES